MCRATFKSWCIVYIPGFFYPIPGFSFFLSARPSFFSAPKYSIEYTMRKSLYFQTKSRRSVKP